MLLEKEARQWELEPLPKLSNKMPAKTESNIEDKKQAKEATPLRLRIKVKAYDHRVIDGALASNFLASMVKSLEKMSDATVDL